MSTTPERDPDIFVSYAHVDDLKDPGVEEGWVTTLIRKVKNRLAQLLGRENAYRLWMDPELAENVQITPQILGQLDRSATLLVVLSPGYVASDWCKWESESFVRKLCERFHDSSRVFIVERDEVDRDRVPTEFHKYGRYQFWERDDLTREYRILGAINPNTDALYNSRIDRLARQLASKIQDIRNAPDDVVAVPGAEPQRPAVPDGAAVTVFVAAATEDLYSQREQVVSYLSQRGMRVVPNLQVASYPTGDAEGLRAAVERDLSDARLFVQLLGGFPSPLPPGVEGGYVGHQQRHARERGLPVFQWRPAWLDAAALERQVQDAGHRALLSGPGVQCVDLETFCGDLAREIERIRARDRRRDEEPRPSGDGGSVFVSYYTAMPHDREVAIAVCEHLKRRGLEVVTPPPDPTDEAMLREEMRYWLVDYPCRAAIVVHGRTSQLWVRRQVGEIHKMAMKLPLAVYQGPPPPKSDPGLMFRNMKLINCVEGLDAMRLEEFIATLNSGVVA
jgi:hypothetical protein